jgi:glyoxylase-like metal-dependent hydrolase (beta-lactamase superfamily II)
MSPAETTDYDLVVEKLPFMTTQVCEEFNPTRVVELSPMVRRVTAPNPGMMTGPGTNTYIVGRESLTIIDPGPASEQHSHRLAALCDGKLDQILLTHTHPDHSPGTALLAELTGAPVMASPVKLQRVYDESFTLNRALQDGDVVATSEYSIRVIHTPGHVANHLCFLLDEPHWLFAGDMVMDGSTVVIAPPDGNMVDYLDSLQTLRGAHSAAIAPAHGRLLLHPGETLQALITHRLGRENKVLEGLKKIGPTKLSDLLTVVYDDVPEVLHPVAALSLEAHLIKLVAEGRAVANGDPVVWALADNHRC